MQLQLAAYTALSLFFAGVYLLHTAALFPIMLISLAELATGTSAFSDQKQMPDKYILMLCIDNLAISSMIYAFFTLFEY